MTQYSDTSMPLSISKKFFYSLDQITGYFTMKINDGFICVIYTKLVVSNKK